MQRHRKVYTHPPEISTSSAQGCSGKRQYDFAASRKLARRLNGNHDGMTAAYHCRHCGRWHLGNSDKQTRERKHAARKTKSERQKWRGFEP